MISRNPVCELLGSTHPIVLAGMGGPSRFELVAAVTRAGGFGFLGMVREPPALIAREVGALRAQGFSRYGVNIIPAATGSDLLEQQLQTIIALEVPVVSLFWDIDPRVVARLREAGVAVVYQVGSVDEAVTAERAGASIIIAQGREAGGHVRGMTALRDLLPQVAAAVACPVLAAGGLATGADLVVANALGASGIALGTALLASDESFAHPYHKQRLLAAEAHDTLLTDLFHINWPPRAPVRVLSSAVTLGARGHEQPDRPEVIGDEEGRPIYLFSTDSPLRSMTGDFESMALYAGTGVGWVTATRSATSIVEDLAAEAELLTRVDDGAPPESSSSVCYAGEMSGGYMGQLDAGEVAGEVAAVVAGLRGGLTTMLDPGRCAEQSVPPFSAGAVDWARWIVALAPFAGAASPVSASNMPVDPLLRRTSLLGQIRAVLPRFPEGAPRRRLAVLASELESDGFGRTAPLYRA